MIHVQRPEGYILTLAGPLMKAVYAVIFLIYYSSASLPASGKIEY